MANSLTEGATLPRPGLSPLILACLAATWLIWGSTYLAIKWALISLPPFFQMGTRFLVAGGLLMAGVRVRGPGGRAPPPGGGAPLFFRPPVAGGGAGGHPPARAPGGS